MNRSIFLTLLLLMNSPLWAQNAPKPKPEPPTIDLGVARDVAPGPKVRLTLNTRNLERLQLRAWRLKGTQWLLDRERGARARPATPGKAAIAMAVDMRAKKEKKDRYQIDWYRSRQLNLPAVRPGIYLVETSGAGKSDWGVINVSNLAIVTKRSPQKLLAWVTDFKTGAIVPGASVALWDKALNRAVVQGKTGVDGATLLTASGGKDQVVVVRRGDDAAGVAISNAQPNGRLTMHFQTDRPIYRPGQRVQFKAILRRTQGRGWAPLSDVSCAIEVRDAKDIVLLQQNLKANAIGTLNGSVTLPVEGSLGQYSITVAPNSGEVQYGAFTVAAYRKPEYQVEISPSRKRYLAGEKVVFGIKASYYFGAPVPKATVRYTVRRTDLRFASDDGVAAWYGGDGNLYNRDDQPQNNVVADASADLDANGQVNIELPTQNLSGDTSYSISATVTDGSRRQVSASSSVPIYRANKRIDIAGEVSYVPVGFLMPLRLRVSDLDGKPSGGRVILVLKKPVWNEKEGRTRYQTITSTSVIVPARGVATAKLPAQIEGNLRVEASLSDGTGRTALAAWEFWVAGPKTQWERDDSPQLTLKPDKRFYAPGETMKILVSSNTPKRLVLASIEGLDVWNYQVIPAGQRNFVWNVPARVEMTPTSYVSAAQWTPSSGLLSTNAILPIPDPSRRLRVSISADKNEYRPGETARYTVSTRDLSGKPVPAEVAVAVVDAALLAIRPDNTPDLQRLFWADRPNFVQMASSAPEELSGGAYQRVGKTASLRQQFLDTAFWNASVQTNVAGTATVEVKIPGNLTTWRATARAITADTRVGAASSSVTATRPVTLRLATPRQLVQGDALDLIASVNNRSDRDRTFETALGGEGITIDGARTKNLSPRARGEAKTTWRIHANTLPASGEATLRGRTLASDATAQSAEDDSDALEGRVPVLPNGIAHRVTQGGTIEREKTLSFALPTDRIEPASVAVLSIRGGLGEVAVALGQELLQNDRYAAPVAASRLLAAALLKPANWQNEARENIALLARYQSGQGGWNWWEDEEANPQITAQIVTALARARARGVTIPDDLLRRGVGGARYLYGNTPLWENRALLATAITLSDEKQGAPLLIEVEKHAESLSPFARLTLAEAFFEAGNAGEATRITREVLKDAHIGTDTAWLPVGERDGWNANAADATSAALNLLLRLGIERALQSKLALWLASPGENGGFYDSLATRSNRLLALWNYDQAHPGGARRGSFTVSLNGQNVTVPADVAYRPLEISLPRAALRDQNTLRIARNGSGEVFFSLEARVFRPSQLEFGNGVRVFRRYDAQNAARTWDELKGPVKVGQAVRCTVVVWPSDRADALRVTEPLPAGFEYVDADLDYGDGGRSEVRDAAVVHYLHGRGLPVTFRYYLRSESTGSVTALPAFAEELQRPATRGNSDATRFEVVE